MSTYIYIYIFDTYSMKQPDLYYFETIKMKSQARSNRLVTSFAWFQNSIDLADS